MIEWNGIAELIGIRLWLLSTATNLLRLSISFYILMWWQIKRAIRGALPSHISTTSIN